MAGRVLSVLFISDKFVGASDYRRAQERCFTIAECATVERLWNTSFKLQDFWSLQSTNYDPSDWCSVCARNLESGIPIVYTYVYQHMSICKYVNINICTYIYIYLHTYVYTRSTKQGRM